MLALPETAAEDLAAAGRLLGLAIDDEIPRDVNALGHAPGLEAQVGQGRAAFIVTWEAEPYTLEERTSSLLLLTLALIASPLSAALPLMADATAWANAVGV